ncbi:Glycoside hydrolase [Trema orientale]|uniref:Glycoside hydrolase n=1 Tax=Trema orientale TaxID=63057 RepID=A0A2P5C3R4_TREOI|nr:Glycoside hydrolase [Trema orientale]
MSFANLANFSTFTQTVQLKNLFVKILIAIRGYASIPFAFALVSSQSGPTTFIALTKIEFPSIVADMANLSVLLTEWRAAANKESKAFGKAQLLLTIVPLALLYHSTSKVRGDSGITA